MTLTKKDFIELAQTIKFIYSDINNLLKLEPEQEKHIKLLIYNRIEKFCITQNSLFNEQKFNNAVFGESIFLADAMDELKAE